MRIAFLLLFFSSFLFGQGIEPSSFEGNPTKFGILSGFTEVNDDFGATKYQYNHSTFYDLMDSLNINITDSIYVSNDTIFLRDGQGFATIDTNMVKGLLAFVQNNSSSFDGLFTSLDFTGTTGISDGIDNVDDPDNNPTNESNTSVTWNNAGNVLTIFDNLGPKSATITGFLESEVDGSINNEGSLSLTDLIGSVLINSNTSGSTPVVLTGQYGIITSRVSNEARFNLDTTEIIPFINRSEVDGDITNELDTMFNYDGSILVDGGTVKTDSALIKQLITDSLLTIVSGADTDWTVSGDVQYSNQKKVGINETNPTFNIVVKDSIGSLDGSNIAFFGDRTNFDGLYVKDPTVANPYSVTVQGPLNLLNGAEGNAGILLGGSRGTSGQVIKSNGAAAQSWGLDVGTGVDLSLGGTLSGKEYYFNRDDDANNFGIFLEGDNVDLVQSGNFLEFNVDLSGVGTVSGTGTDNYIPMFNGTTDIEDSPMNYNFGASSIDINGVRLDISYPSGTSNDVIGSGGNATMFGNSNVIIGQAAGTSLTSGGANFLFGQFSGVGLTSGGSNIFQGNGSGRYCGGTVLSNIGIGTETLREVDGDYNIGIGNNTMTYSSGGNNIGIGQLAMSGSASSTGSYNIAIGSQNSWRYTTGSNNIGLGRNTLFNLSNGTGNLCFSSFGGMFNLTSGVYNIGLGHQTLYSNVSGSYNTSIGFRAGYSNTGSFNVFMGYNAGYFETGSSKLYIDNSSSATPLIFGDFNSNELTIYGELHVSDLVGGTAVNSINVDATGQLVSGFLPITELNIGTVASSVIPIVDFGGTTHFSIATDDLYLKSTEPVPDIASIVYQSHVAALYATGTQTITTTGDIDFSSTFSHTGSSITANATLDEITTSDAMQVMITIHGSIQQTGTCATQPSAFQVGFTVNGVGANGAQSISTGMGTSYDVPFSLSIPYNLGSGADIKARVYLPVEATCDAIIKNPYMTVTSI